MRKFFKVIVTWSVLTAAAIGILWWLGYITLEFDDDRPPVVVSSGSINIESQVDDDDDGPGAFVQVIPGDRKRWRIMHGGRKPSKLSVIIHESTSAAAQCESRFVHKNVTTVTFTYTPTVGIPNQFTAEIGEDGLELALPIDAQMKAGAEHRLTVPEASLRSVTIGGTTCDLGTRGRVELRQRK